MKMLIFSANETLFEKYVFKKVNLFAKFPFHNQTLSMPATLTTSMIPVKIADTIYREGIDYTTTVDNVTSTWQDISLKLNGHLSNILSFAIHQRDFSKDAEIKVGNLMALSKAHSLQHSLQLIFLFVLFLFFK